MKAQVSLLHFFIMIFRDSLWSGFNSFLSAQEEESRSAEDSRGAEDLEQVTIIVPPLPML